MGTLQINLTIGRADPDVHLQTVTRLGDLLDFGQLLKAFDNN